MSSGYTPTIFPTTDNIDKTKYDEGTDVILDARLNLLNVMKNLRDIINSANHDGGVLISDASNKIAKVHLENAVTSSHIQAESVTGDMINGQQIEKDHIADNTIEKRHLNFIDTELSTATDKICTTKHVRDYVTSKSPKVTGTIYVTDWIGGYSFINGQPYTPQTFAYGTSNVNGQSGTDRVIVGIKFQNHWVKTGSNLTYMYSSLHTPSFGNWNEYASANARYGIRPRFKLYYQELEVE